jgi:uncharacterized membrane protein
VLRHPLHPTLVHAPIACWIMTPLCDGLALALGQDFFWQAGALIAAFGVLFGALAATAGAIDLPRAKTKAPRLALVHAGLMASAWALSTLGLFGRITADYAAATPAPIWAIAASAVAFALMLAGAWCGGEMVYGRSVGVRDPN